MMRRNTAAAERTAERRRLEDEAPRLAAVIPSLESLKLNVREFKADVAVAEAEHTRHVVVAHAPLLFILPCRDPACKDGGHDITSEITRALQAQKAEFSGEHSCSGYVGDLPCQRVLHYRASATYRG